MNASNELHHKTDSQLLLVCGHLNHGRVITAQMTGLASSLANTEQAL